MDKHYYIINYNIQNNLTIILIIIRVEQRWKEKYYIEAGSFKVKNK